MRKRVVIGVLAIIGVALVVFLVKAEFSTEWSFVSDAGSRKTDCKSCFGLFTSSQVKESSLEKFMRANHPQSVAKQRWTEYSRTGKNVFGKILSYGEPAVPVPLGSLDMEHLEAYTARLSNEEKKELYDFFATAKWGQIANKADSIRRTLKAK
jgi:hypothetical protein